MFGLLTCLGALLAAPAQDKAAQDPGMDKQTASLRVAVCQTFCIDSDPDGNFRRVQYAVEDAARRGARLACLPECALLGWVNPDAHKLAEPIPGPITERLGELARKHGLMICIGLDEKEGEKLYDSAVLIGSDGRILAKHRKINTLRELLDPPYTRGTPEEIRAVETPIGRVGLLICADTCKQELLKKMGGKRPDLLLVPYGWAADKDQWPGHAKSLQETVCRAAKTVGCPVVGTDCVGMITHGPWTGKTYGGRSLVADRKGEVLGLLRDRDAEVRLFEITPGRGD